MKQELVRYVEKPWGYEKWIAVTDSYAMKEIFLKEGCRCSLQYHNEKEEHSYLLTGRVLVEEDNEQGVLESHEYQPGECWHEKPLAKHRVTAIEDATFIEVSTPHLDDVVRVQDDFGR
ncbi:MAG: hypothetical protein IJ225_11445 [Solobacterium sp.]|nr:hypothetical protein [Solobacterium sp.]